MLPGITPFLGGGFSASVAGSLIASANAALFNFPGSVVALLSGGAAPFTYVWSFELDPSSESGTVTFLSGQGTSTATVRIALVAPGTTVTGYVIATVTDGAGSQTVGSLRLQYTNTTPP